MPGISSGSCARAMYVSSSGFMARELCKKCAGLQPGNSGRNLGHGHTTASNPDSFGNSLLAIRPLFVKDPPRLRGVLGHDGEVQNVSARSRDVQRADAHAAFGETRAQHRKLARTAL